MSSETFNLSDEERALIVARREQKAREESARIDAEKIPDILNMSTIEILKLTPEQQQAAMAANVERVMRRD